MAPGIILLIIGAIFTFAVRTDASAVDLQVVGLIFMLAGAGIIYHARRGTRREHVVTRVEDSADPDLPTHTVRETIIDRDVQ